MPRLNITYAQIDLELLDEEKWLYILNERQQLLYVKLLLLAGRTKNRISNSLPYLKQKLNYQADEKTLNEDLKRIEAVMRDYLIKPNLIFFRRFWQRYSYVAKGNRGNPREIPGKDLGCPNRKERKVIESKGNIKNYDTHKLVFDHWNEQKIVVHKKLSDKMRRAINGRLDDGHKPEEITQAITNYAAILKSKDYWFSYTWTTLQDFLNRGLHNFLDFEIAKANFKIKKGGQYGKPKKPGGVTGDPGKYEKLDSQIDSVS